VERLTSATKVSLLVAVSLLVVALYLLVVPIAMPTSQGVFGCGSALRPPTAPFAVGVCQDVPRIYQLRSATVGLLALVVGLGGWFFFRQPRTELRAGSSADAAEPAPRR
jgi:hypothetical protein